jgi:U3 small nucleolar RNA-associated protein 12
MPQVWSVKGEGASAVAQTIDGPGHRSDVRALALSNDDAMCLSASTNSVKVSQPKP